MLIAWLPSSKECLPTDVPVRPIDRANDVFDPDGGSDDPGPYQKILIIIWYTQCIHLHLTSLLGFKMNI